MDREEKDERCQMGTKRRKGKWPGIEKRREEIEPETVFGHSKDLIFFMKVA